MIWAAVAMTAMAGTSPSEIAAVADSSYPPDYDLSAALWHIEGVRTCRGENVERVRRWIARRYDARMKAIRIAMTKEFGKEAMARDAIVIGDCHWKDDPERQRQVLEESIAAFERDLRRWEKHYNIKRRN